jgi:hypothetical protein
MRILISIPALTLISSLTAVAASSDPAYRLVEFETSSLPNVTAVVDARSGPAGPQPISAGDFGLLEDGRATSAAAGTTKFRDAGIGLALIVAIDVSPSMEGRPLNAIRQGLVQLVSRKRDNDRVTVLSFADDVRWETRWDASDSTMQDAFRNLRTRGHWTRLYDAVGRAMDEFAAEAKQDPKFPARMCILVLSDGHDEGSRTTLNQAVNRLQSSRIRLDAVGLAHSNLWLGNLQVLARAGFGGFRSAGTADALTNLLGQGIDALLDLPAIEFKTERRFGDGKFHQLGVEHLPSHWRDELPVKLPEGPWYTHSKWQLVAGGIIVLSLTALLLARRRPQQQTTVAAAQTTAPTAVHCRIETIAEPLPGPSSTARSAPRPTEAEPRRIMPSSGDVSFGAASPVEARAAADPVRVATTFAPQAPGPVASCILIIEQGPYVGQRFPLSADEFWIGSSTNNHLCLSEDRAVSGNHACIRREGPFLRLYDNGSLNNTLINGRGIGSEVVLLQPGDRIRVGQSELRLEI